VGIFFFFIFFFSLFFQDRRLKCVCVCVCLDASLTASVQPASFPIMRRRRQLRRMRYGGTGETLVSGRLRVDAQRHLAAHQLVHYEFVQFFCCFFFLFEGKGKKKKKINIVIHSLSLIFWRFCFGFCLVFWYQIEKRGNFTSVSSYRRAVLFINNNFRAN